MKTLRFLVAVVVLTLAAGCSSVPRTEADDLADIEFGVYTVTALGAQFAMADNPGTAPYFNAVAAHLTALLEAQNFDPLAFAAALDALPMKELKSPEGRLLITTAAVVFQRYGRRIDINNQVYAAVTMRAVRDGFRDAIAASGWVPAQR